MLIVDHCNNLPLFQVIPYLCACSEYSIIWRAQNASPVTFGFARVWLGCPCPVDASQCVATAGFDDSVAILPCVEARSQPDMERDVHRKRRRLRFYEPCIYHNGKG